MIRALANFVLGLVLVYWNTRARLQFLIRGVTWPKNLTVKGPLGLSALGNIVLGDDITIVNDSKYNRAGVNHPTQLVATTGASLTIGNHVGISGASIYSAESISIGNHVLIGANSKIYDTDFHPLNFMDRRTSQPSATAAVVIEDDVWLCANVTILKGVTIGARSVIAAGSTVCHDIPPDTLAGGTPAKPIKKFELNSGKAMGELE